MKRSMVASAPRLAPLLFLLALPAPARADEGTWEEVGTYDGVRVERKTVPGSPLFAFRGEIVTDIHIGKVLSVFIDREQRKFWVDRFKESTMLEKPGRLTEIYWIHFKLPFPIKDRDYVLRADGE